MEPNLSQSSKKQPEKWAEAHVYMTKAEKSTLGKVARRYGRSVNGQIIFYIYQGLALEEEKRK
jgi:LysM repeat protein